MSGLSNVNKNGSALSVAAESFRDGAYIVVDTEGGPYLVVNKFI